MKRSKQARAREFSKKAREEIISRDGGACIFCRMGYRMPGADMWLAAEIKSIMHYIPRSKGGLGIPQNGAVGCQYHHSLMDNGSKGNRGEMLRLFREYLQGCYPGWDEKGLIYSKWDFMKEG